LISNQAATEVAALNTGNSGPANATLTSLPSPIDASLGSSGGSRIAQLKLDGASEPLKVGEKRRIAVALKSDVPVGLAVLTLKFDPRVIKLHAVSAGTMLTEGKELIPALGSSVDPNGLCLISISTLNGAQALNGAGILVFLEIEALGAGDSGLAFDKVKTSLMATDARDVVIDLAPGQITVKQ
jgi:hypothetical protein